MNGYQNSSRQRRFPICHSRENGNPVSNGFRRRRFPAVCFMWPKYYKLEYYLVILRVLVRLFHVERLQELICWRYHNWRSRQLIPSKHIMQYPIYVAQASSLWFPLESQARILELQILSNSFSALFSLFSPFTPSHFSHFSHLLSLNVAKKQQGHIRDLIAYFNMCFCIFLAKNVKNSSTFRKN